MTGNTSSHLASDSFKTPVVFVQNNTVLLHSPLLVSVACFRRRPASSHRREGSLLLTTTAAGPTETLLLVATRVLWEVQCNQVGRRLPITTNRSPRQEEHQRLLSNGPDSSSNDPQLISTHIGEPNRVEPATPPLTAAPLGQFDQSPVVLVTVAEPVACALQVLPDNDNSGISCNYSTYCMLPRAPRYRRCDSRGCD